MANIIFVPIFMLLNISPAPFRQVVLKWLSSLPLTEKIARFHDFFQLYQDTISAPQCLDQKLSQFMSPFDGPVAFESYDARLRRRHGVRIPSRFHRFHLPFSGGIPKSRDLLCYGLKEFDVIAKILFLAFIRAFDGVFMTCSV
jgi:hypothetical protein